MRGDAAEHLGRVLRAQAGQLYELSDGQSVFLAKIEYVATKRGEPRIEFSLVEPVEAHEESLRTTLLLSIVKFERFEWALEKATELGATEFVPLAAARTDKALIAAAQKRRDRWQKILVESAQQSRRLRPPLLSEIATPAKAFANSDAECRVVLSERTDAPSLKKIFASQSSSSANASASAALAIGPEGGWTDEEISAARAAKFVEASLGATILRTETAVIASLAVVRFALGE